MLGKRVEMIIKILNNMINQLSTSWTYAEMKGLKLFLFFLFIRECFKKS